MFLELSDSEAKTLREVLDDPNLELSLWDRDTLRLLFYESNSVHYDAKNATKIVNALKEYKREGEVVTLYKKLLEEFLASPKEIWLLTPEQYKNLPGGTKLTSIRGKQKTKGEDCVSQDTKDDIGIDGSGTGNAYLAWGLTEKDAPEGFVFDDYGKWIIK